MAHLNDRDFDSRLHSGQTTSNDFSGFLGDLSDQQRQLLDRNDAIASMSWYATTQPNALPNTESIYASSLPRQLSSEEMARNTEAKAKSKLDGQVSKFETWMYVVFYVLTCLSFAFSTRDTSAGSDYLGIAFVSIFVSAILYFTVGRILKSMYRRRLQRQS